MKPSGIIPLTGNDGPGQFQIEHGLDHVPYAAIPVPQGPGVIRLRTPIAYDSQYVYLSASDAGIKGYVAVW